MRLALALTLLLASCQSVTNPSKAVTTQDLQVYNFGGPRRASNVVLFGKDMAAGITVVHGQPEWKADYDGMLDRLKGKTHRLGKDLWTTFMTSATVQLAGVEIEPGCYCVGLHCDEDGKFALAMIDANKAMKRGLMPFGPQTWKADVTVPLTFEKDASDLVFSKMMIDLGADAKDKMQGRFQIAWGTHVLSAPMQIQAPAN
jgi:hypothetical protein